MIDLSYTLSKDWNERTADIDWTYADETTLRYRALLGDQVIIINGADFSAKWGWVPILDFASCLLSITKGLEAGELELTFEFTESNAKLNFKRQNNDVLISANYCNEKSAVQLNELITEVNSYAKRCLADAIQLHPGLEHNNSFINWYHS
jgi:hypothetical protein